MIFVPSARLVANGGWRTTGLEGVVSTAMNREFPPPRAADKQPTLKARPVLPPHAPGMRIGLFGGTFDPAHAAHRAACLLAMKRIGLDRVWWLVTPGNPLKDTHDLAPLEQRVIAARALANHPRIDVSDLEAEIGTRYTYQTIRYLLRRCPHVHFVWIMGADNLRSFHRWQRWRDIAALVPIAVVDRLGPSLYASAGVAGQALAYARIPESTAKMLPERRPPAWIYLHGLKSPLSSTALRAARALQDE
jgi:nicotinate-nucleotide adenylyltransferase